jgi:hypothetical protein
VLSLPVDRLPPSICVRSIQFFSFVPTMLCFGFHMILISCHFSFYPTLFYLWFFSMFSFQLPPISA